MKPHLQIVCGAVLGLALLCIPLSVTWGEDRAEGTFPDLVERNPFVPPAVSGPPAPTPTPSARASSIRFAGTVQMGGTRRFAVQNQQSGKAFWMEEGEERDGFKIIGWDPAGPRLQIREAGEVRWIEFVRPEIPVTTPSTQPQRDREMTREERREAWRAAAAERMREARERGEEARERGEPPPRRRISVPNGESNGD